MSRRAAIEQATGRVSPLREIEPGQWGYHVWSQNENAWIPAIRTESYAEARRKRASTIAALAAHALLRDAVDGDETRLAWQIIGSAYRPDNTGTVSERLTQILRESQ